MKEKEKEDLGRRVGDLLRNVPIKTIPIWHGKFRFWRGEKHMEVDLVKIPLSHVCSCRAGSQSGFEHQLTYPHIQSMLPSLPLHQSIFSETDASSSPVWRKIPGHFSQTGACDPLKEDPEQNWVIFRWSEPAENLEFSPHGTTFSPNHLCLCCGSSLMFQPDEMQIGVCSWIIVCARRQLLADLIFHLYSRYLASCICLVIIAEPQ